MNRTQFRTVSRVAIVCFCTAVVSIQTCDAQTAQDGSPSRQGETSQIANAVEMRTWRSPTRFWIDRPSSKLLGALRPERKQLCTRDTAKVGQSHFIPSTD